MSEELNLGRCYKELLEARFCNNITNFHICTDIIWLQHCRNGRPRYTSEMSSSFSCLCYIFYLENPFFFDGCTRATSMFAVSGFTPGVIGAHRTVICLSASSSYALPKYRPELNSPVLKSKLGPNRCHLTVCSDLSSLLKQRATSILTESESIKECPRYAEQPGSRGCLLMRSFISAVQMDRGVAGASWLCRPQEWGWQGPPSPLCPFCSA